MFNSLPTSVVCCETLQTVMTQNVSPHLRGGGGGGGWGPNCLTVDTLVVLLKYFFEKVKFEKNHQATKQHKKDPIMQRVQIARLHISCESSASR